MKYATGKTGRTTARAVRIAHERVFREPADNMATTRAQPSHGNIIVANQYIEHTIVY